MEYSRADYLTGIGQKAFIAELMPRHPVYTAMLPDAARAAIGEVHADTLPARAMLESEGFRYEGYVDIFDAGPTLECFRDDIRAVKSAISPKAAAACSTDRISADALAVSPAAAVAISRPRVASAPRKQKSPAQRPGFPIVESKLATGANACHQPRELISP